MYVDGSGCIKNCQRKRAEKANTAISKWIYNVASNNLILQYMYSYVSLESLLAGDPSFDEL